MTSDILNKKQYLDLGSHLRELVVDEIQTGDYYHLKMPDTKSGRNLELHKRKFRLNVLPRPPVCRTGEPRSMTIGRDELVLIIHGNLIEDVDYQNGFKIDQQYAWRIGSGAAVGKIAIAFQMGYRDVKGAIDQLAHFLEKGDYVTYVNRLMRIVDGDMIPYIKAKAQYTARIGHG